MAGTIRILGFQIKHTKVGDKTVSHDWVTFGPAHAIQTVVNEERVDRLRPRDDYANDDQGLKAAYHRARWAEIEPAYKAWQEGNEIPDHGTPLAAWPGVTSDQATVLRQSGIRTVEDVASIPDSALNRIHLPDMRALREQARLYLDARETTAAAEAMQKRDEKIAALEEQLAAAMALLEEQTAPAGKPRRGRPPKPDDATEAE